MKPLLKRTLVRATQLSLLQAMDVAQDRLASFVQPDKRARLWGVNSFCELPVHVGVGGHTAGLLMGFRMPQLPGLHPALGSGLWLSIAGRDVALTVRGVPGNGVLSGGELRDI